MTKKQKPKRRVRSTLSEADAAPHTVYYRATQVKYAIGCFEEMRVPKVGMRLAMLHTNGEFSKEIPEEKFYPGRITEVTKFRDDDYTVTVEFDGTMPATKSMTFGWNYYSRFCVPLPDELKRLMRSPYHRSQKSRNNTSRQP